MIQSALTLLKLGRNRFIVPLTFEKDPNRDSLQQMSSAKQVTTSAFELSASERLLNFLNAQGISAKEYETPISCR